jgi:hypothetical protein
MSICVIAALTRFARAIHNTPRQRDGQPHFEPCQYIIILSCCTLWNESQSQSCDNTSLSKCASLSSPHTIAKAMDPLSVTASIIAVIQATSAVVSICYDYSSAIKGASWELIKIIDEVRDLRNVLESLERLARQEESSKPAISRLPSLRLLCEPETGVLAQCLTDLHDLDKKLRPSGYPAGSKRRALIQASGWPFKKGAVEKTLAHIGRLKATLTLAITADEA